jgi:hypothetical protein
MTETPHACGQCECCAAWRDDHAPSVDGWRDIASAPAPANGTPFDAYGPELIHPDFIPNGCVEACFDGERFIGAVWDGQHDCWITRPITFTHWKTRPAPPVAGPAEETEP